MKDTSRLNRKDQPINATYGNYPGLLRGSYETYNCTVWKG